MINYEMMKNSGIDSYDCYYRAYAGYSFVAYLLGLTNIINPLPPHYRCRNAHYTEFSDSTVHKTCFGLPEKKCPICGARLEREGFNLTYDMSPFCRGEYLFGFEINVPSSRLREMVNILKRNERLSRIIRLGKERGGDLIPSLDEDTIRGYYLIPNGKEHLINDKRIQLYKGDEIINSIGPDSPKGFYTEWILEDDPTNLLYCLKEYTGVAPKVINLFDKRLLSIFSSCDALGRAGHNMSSMIGTLGIPKFRRGFVIDVLREVKPQTFNDLVKICGLMCSHGTWFGNAEILVKNRACSLEEVIATRDDVYDDCVRRGVEKDEAFKIAESVRKGYGLNTEMLHQMRNAGFDEWYIDSCQKINYLYSRGYCTAIVLQALQAAYYKIYFPEDFYSAFFNTMISEDIRRKLLEGEEQNMQMLDDMRSGKVTDDFDLSLWGALLVAEEMYERQIDVL